MVYMLTSVIFHTKDVLPQLINVFGSLTSYCAVSSWCHDHDSKRYHFLQLIHYAGYYSIIMQSYSLDQVLQHPAHRAA